MGNMKTPFGKALEYLLRTTKGANQSKVGAFAGISQPFVSALKAGDQEGTEATRRKIAEYFNYDYESFLQLGQDLIQQEKGSAPSSKHKSIKPDQIEAPKKDTEQMDQDVLKILQDHIESLKENNERERQAYELIIANLREDIERGRADLERERQEHKNAMAELREDYRELKVDNKDLRQGYNQLLEQYRALKLKKAQPCQSPDKPKEKKKAVNQ
jgi:transcriptional regulator with XRE-family HTH domain